MYMYLCLCVYLYIYVGMYVYKFGKGICIGKSVGKGREMNILTDGKNLTTYNPRCYNIH